MPRHRERRPVSQRPGARLPASAEPVFATVNGRQQLVGKYDWERDRLLQLGGVSSRVIHRLTNSVSLSPEVASYLDEAAVVQVVLHDEDLAIEVDGQTARRYGQVVENPDGSRRWRLPRRYWREVANETKEEPPAVSQGELL